MRNVLHKIHATRDNPTNFDIDQSQPLVVLLLKIHGRWMSVSSPGPWHAAHITLVTNFVHQSTIHLVRRYESFRKLLISLGHLVLKKFHNILHHLPEFRYLYFQWDRLLVIINAISVCRHSLKTRVLALVRQFAPCCSRLTCQHRTLFLAHIPVARSVVDRSRMDMRFGD